MVLYPLIKVAIQAMTKDTIKELNAKWMYQNLSQQAILFLPYVTESDSVPVRKITKVIMAMRRTVSLMWIDRAKNEAPESRTMMVFMANHLGQWQPGRKPSRLQESVI
jgi:hypothetical protein